MGNAARDAYENAGERSGEQESSFESVKSVEFTGDRGVGEQARSDQEKNLEQKPVAEQVKADEAPETNNEKDSAELIREQFAQKAQSIGAVSDTDNIPAKAYSLMDEAHALDNPRDMQEAVNAIKEARRQAEKLLFENKVNETGEETYGMLFFADIKSFENELHSEIEKVLITDTLVENWTYPLIQPKLIEEAKKRGFI